MNILPYKLDTTNDLRTSRAGLLAVAQRMASLQLSERIDQHFPLPQSNRGLPPSTFIETLLLMQHEGSVHLDDSRHLQDDEARRTVLNLTHIPKATTLGDWLRRMGNHRAITVRWRLYAMAAKVVKTGRQLLVKLKAEHRGLLERVLIALRQFDPPPV